MLRGRTWRQLNSQTEIWTKLLNTHSPLGRKDHEHHSEMAACYLFWGSTIWSFLLRADVLERRRTTCAFQLLFQSRLDVVGLVFPHLTLWSLLKWPLKRLTLEIRSKLVCSSLTQTYTAVSHYSKVENHRHRAFGSGAVVPLPPDTRMPMPAVFRHQFSLILFKFCKTLPNLSELPKKKITLCQSKNYLLFYLNSKHLFSKCLLGLLCFSSCSPLC